MHSRSQNLQNYNLCNKFLFNSLCTVFIFFRDLFVPYIFATGGAVASAIALKEMVVKVIL